MKKTLLTTTILLLAVGTAPAFAVSIRHTNRAGGDTEATPPSTHGTPPADSSGLRYFDKAHESGVAR